MQVRVLLRRGAAWSAPVAAALAVAAVAYPSDEQHAYRPAPAAVAEYAPVGYEGRQILPTAEVDVQRATVTMPLRSGRMADGRRVWYVLTDASDKPTARRLGLNFSPKLRKAPASATRSGRMIDGRGTLVFDTGAVDFSPRREVVPGPAAHPFPPLTARAGSIGDDDYSPLVRVTSHPGLVLNATVVAFDVPASQIEFPDGDVDYDKVIDRAVAISPAAGTVTFSLSVGTASAHPILFVSLDSSSRLVAALEATTVAPALANLPVARDDAQDSAVAANYIIANGPTGAANPQRQGLDSALSDPGAHVLDIFDGAPGVLNGDLYSPMWDLYVAEWTPEAVSKGYRARVDSELELVGMARRGWITGLGGGPLDATGLISNCPLVMSF